MKDLSGSKSYRTTNVNDEFFDDSDEDCEFLVGKKYPTSPESSKV